MLFFQSYILPVLFLASLGATKLAHQHGWLDRLVAYHKKTFLKELAQFSSPLTVTVEKAPDGFVDSPDWDKESVLRLVMLVEVLDAKPARQLIRRALSPSRRYYYEDDELWRHMPILSKNHPNDFAYDYDQSPSRGQPRAPPPPSMMLLPTDETVVYISNPIEAHLPSSRITVKLLRELLETRAEGLRVMPTKPRSTFSWITSGKTSAGTGTGSEGSTQVATDSTNDTSGADQESTVASDTNQTAETGAETEAETTPAAA